MDKEFVPYQESLELKELGFDEPCLAVFNDSKQFRINSESTNWNDNVKNGDTTSSPLYQQAFRWFRDNFGLSGWVDESFTTNNRQGVVSVKSPKGLEYIQSPKSTMFFETYEEAELACLRKLIEIVKQK